MNAGAVRKLALALPEAAEAPHHQYTSFRVRGRIFATVPPEGQVLHVFVGDEQRDRALALYPEACAVLMWGAKIAGLRVDLERATPAAVRELLQQAWTAKAPKALQPKAPERA